MKHSKIKYVQLEPGAFLTDPDFIKMTPSQRGIYWSLILALYCNEGSLIFDKNIGTLCGCSFSHFIKIFAKISFKFREKNGKIFHKKVSKVLAHQKKLMQIAKKSGLKGARVTWGAHSNENETKNETKSKINNINSSNSKSNNITSNSKESFENEVTSNHFSNSTSNFVRSSNSPRENAGPDFGLKIAVNKKAVVFAGKINKILFAKTQSDRTCFKRVGQFLIDGCLAGKWNLNVFDQAIDLAKEASTGEKPNALFMSLMARELGYERNHK